MQKAWPISIPLNARALVDVSGTAGRYQQLENRRIQADQGMMEGSSVVDSGTRVTCDADSLAGAVEPALSAWLFALTRAWVQSRMILDHPNEWSLHNDPIPRGGGFGIVVPVIFGLVAVWSLIFDPALTPLSMKHRREGMLRVHQNHLYQRLVLNGASPRAVIALCGVLAGAEVVVGKVVAQYSVPIAVAGKVRVFMRTGGLLSVTVWQELHA